MRNRASTARGNRNLVPALALLLFAGCRTVPPPPVLPADRARVPVEITLGRVRHVNPKFRHAIVRCGSLPSEGEEAKVYREGKVVGGLRMSGPAHYPFAAADILVGDPEEGDVVKVVRMKVMPRSGGEK